MPTDQLKLEIRGTRALLKKLAPKRHRSIVSKAINTATNPVKTAMRRNIRKAGARRKDILLKSIRSKVKRYSSGVVVAYIGPRSQKVDGERPTRYAHLADKGVRPHQYKRNLVHVRTHPVGWFTHKGGHPGAKGKPFLKQSEAAMDEVIRTKFRKRLQQLVEKELAKS